MREKERFIPLKGGDKVRVTEKYDFLFQDHKKWKGCIVTLTKIEGINNSVCYIKEFKENGTSPYIPRSRLEKISFELPEELFEIE